ncbi:LysR family transcriptional regulator [Mesorhizobium sp. M1252]|uniref:LysR family transcriptional regulator n=1 Tax=Mesorhizobium sp. M1252 TaxID=2957073 RepID=UPI00333C96D2
MTETTLPLPPLDWLRSFEAAARLSNFTAAAAELGLTQAAISQHIRSLEERLKQPLFIRLARGVELTPEGAAYLPHLQSAFAVIANSTRELFEPKTVQSVTIRSPISFAVLMIAPKLPQMAKDLPFVQLQIETIHTPADYGERFVGLDIRFGIGSGSFAGRQADRLTRETLTPMASPHLANVKDWTGLPRLTVVGAREMWGEWFAVARMKPALGPTHKFDSFVTALEAAKHGAGMVLGSRPLADAALREGSLVTLSGFTLSSGAGHYLTAPSGAHLSPAEEAVRRWFVTVFGVPISR